MNWSQRAVVDIFPDGAQAAKGKAFVGISLNNRLSGTEEALRQIFEWTKERLGPFDLLIGDYLQRHNYQAFRGFSEPVAIEKAMQEGERTMEFLRSLTNRLEFDHVSMISARSFYTKPDFDNRCGRFGQLYAERDDFKSLVREGADSFLARKYPELLHDDSVYGHCIQYQLEELAIFEVLVERGFGAFVYAGGQLPVMKAIVSGALEGVSSALEKLVLVELRLFK